MSIISRLRSKYGKERSQFERDLFLAQYERSVENFGLEIELDEDRDRDEIYSEWDDTVNITANQLTRWSKNPCSREASLDPEAVIKRNLRLLSKNKSDWTEEDYDDAERTISFINRMRGARPDSPREGTHGCPSPWAISLLNWAYNPFDSIPEPNSEVKNDLEPVDGITMSSELQERRNIKEAENLAHHAWTMTDVMQMFSSEFNDLAVALESEKDLDNVRDMRAQMINMINLLENKISPTIRDVKNNPVEELQEDQKYDYEFAPIPQQVLYENRGDAMERAEELGLDGVHRHPVVFRPPEEIPDDLMDDVTVYNMAGGEHSDWAEVAEEDYEISPVPQQVLYENNEDAMQRAKQLGLEDTHLHPMVFLPPEEVPEDVLQDSTIYYMPGAQHSNWTDRVVPEEMSEERRAAEVFHADQQRMTENSDNDGVRVDPVSIHKIEGGENVEVSENVQDALDQIWQN